MAQYLVLFSQTLKPITMKKLIYISIALIAVLSSCDYDYLPVADFTADKDLAYTEEGVRFTNYSTDATYYEWDFGDGFISSVSNPTHYYTEPGIYTVQLAAFDYKDNVDFAYVTVEVIRPTASLEIVVKEYYDEYPVPEASVILYPTYEDWLNETNSIIEVFTDRDGVAIVDGLDPIPYYLDVYHTTHNNYQLEAEDINFIKTPALQGGTTTIFTAWVDYVPNNKRSLKHEKSLKSAKLNKRNLEDKTK